MNSLKEAKNHTYYSLDDIISVKNHNQNKIKIIRNSYKNILTSYISYGTMNSVKSLYLIINKINGYIKESNGKRYLKIISTDSS